jgi:transposase
VGTLLTTIDWHRPQYRRAPHRWMPTLSAVRNNAWLRAHNQRLLARGKLPKVALVACMHKLLLAIYRVAKHRRPFVAHLGSAEATP